MYSLTPSFTHHNHKQGAQSAVDALSSPSADASAPAPGTLLVLAHTCIVSASLVATLKEAATLAARVAADKVRVWTAWYESLSRHVDRS